MKMTAGTVNIFLPVKLCDAGGILICHSDSTFSNVICSALLPLEESRRHVGSTKALKSRIRTSGGDRVVLGLLVRGSSDVQHVTDNGGKTYDFRVHLDVQNNLVDSSVTDSERKTLVVFYDAVRLANTSSLREDQHSPLTPLLLKRVVYSFPANVESSVVYASTKSNDVPLLWFLVLYVARVLQTLRRAVFSKLPEGVTNAFTRCVKVTSTGSLICKRLNDIIAVQDSVEQHGHITLSCKNRIFSIVVDCLLGLCLALAVHRHQGLPTGVSWASLEWTETVVQHLQDLVEWLMGAPAGLKLNAPLNNALGRFFLYHISLWETYVGILHPWVAALLRLWPGSLTLHLALASDLLALSTVHIYCFYGYACRLYQGWVGGLGALGRLFRGTKWNPLRERVDSHRYDVDQMFVGTLLFTILLFLFPTVAVYYTVFLGLRLAVLAAQGILSRAVIVWDSFPLYTLAARTFGGNPVVGDINFDVLSSGQRFALFLQVIPGNVKLWPDHLGGPPWKEFVMDIIVGRIVYPL
ncbi:unnamed protein product [Ixodes pacificus]